MHRTTAILSIYIHLTGTERSMLSSSRMDQADVRKTGPYRAAVPGAPSRGGWSVFLCDSAGNVVDHAGTTREPCVDCQELPIVKDLPPGRRLLFIRP